VDKLLLLLNSISGIIYVKTVNFLLLSLAEFTGSCFILTLTIGVKVFDLPIMSPCLSKSAFRINVHSTGESTFPKTCLFDWQTATIANTNRPIPSSAVIVIRGITVASGVPPCLSTDAQATVSLTNTEISTP
ncbi:hypothetical protein PMAYCL1PPCAC_28119, partial [Pristionchus mayeri]